MIRTAGVVVVAVSLALLLTACSLRSDDGTADGTPSSPDGRGLDISFEGWETDFSTHSVPLAEFQSGGPPRDGIPPVDEPKFVAVGEQAIPPREPVIALRIGDDARAYPLRIMIWHEIVNDTVGATPVAVTFCPLCNTALVFDRRVGGRTLDFGTTGNLRLSDLVMWDRQTESWWQQFTGEAVVGELTGTELEPVPARIMSSAAFAEEFPDGRVLSTDTGHSRPYGQNPYAGYDDVDSPPFLLRDRQPDGRLPPKERVVTVDVDEELVVYPLPLLEERGLIEDEVGAVPVLVWWQDGTASALDSETIAEGRDVGAATVLDRRADGRTLTFEAAGANIRDSQTGSTWNRDGLAVDGPLAGERLAQVVHDTPFWFAVAAFRPDARIG